MLYRKIASVIEHHLLSDSKKIMLIDGARQIGKTYIIRHVGQKCFENFIEINMVEDMSPRFVHMGLSRVRALWVMHRNTPREHWS